MRNLFLLICLYAFGELGNSNSVPFITKCNLSDSKCLKKSTQAAIPIFASGLPDLGIEPLEPVLLKKVDASTPNLNLVASNLLITGLKNCIAKKLFINDAKPRKFLFKFECTADLKGNYEMKGQILILPIEGKGKVHSAIRKIVITINGEFHDITGKDGETYLEIRNWSHTFDLKDKCDLVFENLFNGNEVLGRAAQDVINSSANDVIFEIGPPIITAVVTKVVDSIQTFFHAVPFKDLVL
ncbi:circadian clock-controlled protein daywake-like [Achroia grisella]|uniref:circadian clock-controlled protein daywake-like n=1 Tax=Achroia grisella TaxID=688607 RepID=UPI0027D2255D|nr:circadian clock-controlled protein daywake-like [Achroia grisella]